jgi:hypothetical protein
MTEQIKFALVSIAFSLVAVGGVAASRPAAAAIPTPAPAPATYEATLQGGAGVDALQLVPQAKSCKPGWVCCEYFPIPNMGCKRCAPTLGAC